MTPDFPKLTAIRLGYGLSPLMAPPDDLKAVLASVEFARAPDGWTTEQASEVQNTYSDLQKARKAAEEAAVARERAMADTAGPMQDVSTAKNDDPASAGMRAFGDEMNRLRHGVLQRRIARGLAAPAGFGERLVQFWADHFTAVPLSPQQHIMAGAFVDEAIRPHLNGRFGDMLFACSTHPMMLVYLNQTSSFGPNSVSAKRRPDLRRGLNENLAREILELHSLGVGADYSQTDVRELAELLTGLSYSSRDPRRYRPQITEPGADTVLGRSYGGPGTNGMDEIGRALRDLAIAPSTADHIARKLAVHFASDDPPADLVDDLAATWRDTGGDLAQVNTVLAGHPALARTFRQKARQPLDFIISSLRALGISADKVLAMTPQESNQMLWTQLQLMGQPFSRARGPDGWPERAADWITPQMLSARIGWAMRVPARLLDPLPDPRAFLRTALQDTASEALLRAVPRAESAREGVAIVLASTDFNRR